MRLVVSRIRPGDWGKVESGWWAQLLWQASLQGEVEEAGFTGSSGSVRALSVYAKKELSDEGRKAEKPLRVESSSPGGFRARANGSYPEGIGRYCRTGTGRRLWRVPGKGAAQAKPLKGGTKVSVWLGKGTLTRQEG